MVRLLTAFSSPVLISPLPKPQRNFDCLFTSAEEQNAGREISTPWVEVGILGIEKCH
jgi:hypothetical protein